MRIREILETFNLSSDRSSRLDTYSKGMRQKVLIAAALLHNPELILLDEPLSGLDVNAAIMIKDLIAALAADGRTILYSSHVLDVVEKVCRPRTDHPPGQPDCRWHAGQPESFHPAGIARRRFSHTDAVGQRRARRCPHRGGAAIMNAIWRAIDRFLRGSAAVNAILRRLGIDAVHYWLLMDLFGKLSERRELFSQLGRDSMSLQRASWFFYFLSG